MHQVKAHKMNGVEGKREGARRGGGGGYMVANSPNLTNLSLLLVSHTPIHTHTLILTLSTDGCSRKAEGKLVQCPNQTDTLHINPLLPLSIANHCILSTQTALLIKCRLDTLIHPHSAFKVIRKISVFLHCSSLITWASVIILVSVR